MICVPPESLPWAVECILQMEGWPALIFWFGGLWNWFHWSRRRRMKCRSMLKVSRTGVEWQREIQRW